MEEQRSRRGTLVTQGVYIGVPVASVPYRVLREMIKAGGDREEVLIAAQDVLDNYKLKQELAAERKKNRKPSGKPAGVTYRREYYEGAEKDSIVETTIVETKKEEESKSYTISKGRYAGFDVRELPTEYMQWMLNNVLKNGKELQKRFEAELKARQDDGK